MISQIAHAFRVWKDVLDELPGVEDVGKIILFSDHILIRQLDLYKEYSTRFPNIYKERVAEYFVKAEEPPIV